MFGNTARTFSSTDIYNESLASVMYSVANSCSSTTGISQTINLRGAHIIGCPITQSSKSNVNFQCLQSVSFGSEIQGKFSNTFREKLDAKVAALGLGAFNTSESISITNLTNRVATNINVSALSSCINSHIDNQTIKMDGATMDCTKGGSIEQTATLDMVTSCKQLNDTTISALTEIDNIIQKKLDASSSTIPTWVIIVVVAILGLGMLMGIILFVGKSKKVGRADDILGVFDEFMESY